VISVVYTNTIKYVLLIQLLEIQEICRGGGADIP
jgi:hypothetical protein